MEGIPTLVLIDRKGIVRRYFVGAPTEEEVRGLQADIRQVLAQK